MQTDPTSLAFIIGKLIGGAVAGAICGLLPLLVGNARGHRQLGLMGFISCTLAGVVMGLVLALPVAAVLTIIILVKKPPISQ